MEKLEMDGSSVFHNIHNKALLLFFFMNLFFWGLWGSICLVMPGAWSGEVIPGMNIYDLSQAAARTEVRAMYGGFQIAVGLLALTAIIKPNHRETALLFFVIALTALVIARLLGLAIEGSEKYLIFSTNLNAESYNQVGLAMYEVPYCIFSWILFLTRKKTITA
jgi:hypothetical protein